MIGIDNHLYIGFCVSFVCLASYESIFNMPSVVIDIEKVMIPSCAFCIQMQILYNARPLGELSYSLYSPIIKSFDPHQVCVDGRQVLLFMMLCAIMEICRGLCLL